MSLPREDRDGSPLAQQDHTPRINQVIPRQRLFQLLQQADQASAVWIAGPAGSAKTSLMASFLAADEFPTIWYQIGAGDGDLSTIFYYLAQAATPVINQSTTRVMR